MTGLRIGKEGLAAPLLFSALALAGYGSAAASPALWFCSLALLWAGASFLVKPEISGLTVLGIAVCVFALWIVGTNFWANPSYTSAAPYHAAFLVSGFYVGRRAGAAGGGMLLSVALTFAVGVSIWGVWQWFSQNEMRAHSLFITPATLGSLVNLLLLPTLVLFACGSPRRILLPILVILGVTLGLAQSRGAWVAFGGAVVAILLLAHRAGVAVDRRRLAIAAMILACGVALSWVAADRPDVVGAYPGETPFSTVSFNHRIQLYDLAVKSIANSPWLVGTGYHSFFYLLEFSRASIPAFVTAQTYFVHNDYLQVLLELGLPGLMAMLAIVSIPLLRVWRALGGNALPTQDRVILIAAVAAITSMAVHALVDFPFYIPVCILLFGVALGILDAVLLRVRRGLSVPRLFANVTFRRVAGAALGTLVAWILILPVVAEAASIYGTRQWQAGRGQNAAFGLEAARRLDPRDWRYHWYAGQFWMAEALNRADRTAAAFAERALVAAQAANSREVRPLYDRILLNRRLGKLLATPASRETLVAWANRAVELSPSDPAVRAERDSLVKELQFADQGNRK